MHLRTLYLHNFRLYEEAFFEFSPKTNVICGPNARGKTSLLEAIYFLMTGRSFRTSQMGDLIRHGATFFCLDASFVKHDIEQKVKVYYSLKEKKVICNSTSYPTTSALLGLLQGVVIHPDDAAVVKGSPAIRRHLLDLQLAQADPVYIHHLTRYDRAMRQRNHLLKAKSQVTIESWEYEMANAAAYIVQQRALVVQELQEKGSQFYANLCQSKEALTLIYKVNGAGDKIAKDLSILRELYRDQYQRHRKKEMEMGATLTGVHKDDLLINLNNKEARFFASEGQQRSCVVALRLAEWARLQALAEESPLMLIDDLGMSLDQSRRSQLLTLFTLLDQVFVTTTDEKQFENEHLIKM